MIDSIHKTIPWFQPQTDEDERRCVLEVLDSNYLNEGEWTERFEKAVKTHIGIDYAVGVSNGTSALTLSLMAAGIGPGDEVIVPNLTFIATANAVRLAGAEVKLVDIEPHRMTLDPDQVKKSLSRKTKAIVTVDVNGRGAAYDFFEAFCQEKGLVLICDAAEALGSSYQNRKLGTFGDAAAFSFSSNKTVTTGQGGMVVTRRRDLYEKVLALKDQGRPKRGSGGNDLHPYLGFNFKLTNLQAAVGVAQMRKLELRLQQSKRRDHSYWNTWKDLKGIHFFEDFEKGEFRQWTDCLVDEPHLMENLLTEMGFGFRRFWFPLHRQEPYAKSSGSFPVSEAISGRGFWLASSFALEEEQIREAALSLGSRLKSIAMSSAND
jgi:perosamine synthetase